MGHLKYIVPDGRLSNWQVVIHRKNAVPVITTATDVFFRKGAVIVLPPAKLDIAAKEVYKVEITQLV
jgi:hypothetical protein